MEINQRLGNFQINFIMVDKYGDVIISEPKMVFIFKFSFNL